ncbi:MAG: hypothetical protein ACOX17_05065 [Christensenellales bacterium]
MPYRMTKENLKEHIMVFKWVYLVSALMAGLAFAMIFSVSKPRIPNRNKLQIISSEYLDDTASFYWQEELRAVIPETIAYIEVGTTSGAIGQAADMEVVFARMVAQDADLWLINRNYYDGFASQGAWLALDLPDESGRTLLDRLLIPDSVNVNDAVTDLQMTDEKGITNGEFERHICGIPLDAVEGLYQLECYPMDLVAAIPVYTDNVDECIAVIQWMLDNKMEYVAYHD